MKKILISFVILLIILMKATSYAENLTLEDMLKKVETSPTIDTLNNKLEGLDILYLKMKDISELLASINFPNITDSQTRANMGLTFTKADRLSQDKSIYVVPDQIKSSYNVLAKNKEAALNRLKLGVEGLYDGLILSSMGIELQEKVLEVDELGVNNAKNKYDEGLISKNDYNMAVLKYKGDRLKLNSQKRSYQNLIYSLNKMAGVNLCTTYDKINENINEIPMPDIDIENAVNDALENRAEVYSLNEDIKNLEKELFFTHIYYSQDEPECESAQIKLQAAEEKLDNLKDNIRYELEDAKDLIEQNYNDVQSAKSELETANQNYKPIKDKYDVGLIPKDILDASYIGVLAAQLNLISAVNTYNMSVKKSTSGTVRE